MKIKKVLKLIAFTILFFVFASCANTLLIRSYPEGADVYVKDQKIGTTPCHYSYFKIFGLFHESITLKKEGYEDIITNAKEISPNVKDDRIRFYLLSPKDTTFVENVDTSYSSQGQDKKDSIDNNLQLPKQAILEKDKPYLYFPGPKRIYFYLDFVPTEVGYLSYWHVPTNNISHQNMLYGFCGIKFKMQYYFGKLNKKWLIGLDLYWAGIYPSLFLSSYTNPKEGIHFAEYSYSWFDPVFIELLRPGVFVKSYKNKKSGFLFQMNGGISALDMDGAVIESPGWGINWNAKYWINHFTVGLELQYTHFNYKTDFYLLGLTLGAQW